MEWFQLVDKSSEWQQCYRRQEGGMVMPCHKEPVPPTPWSGMVESEGVPRLAVNIYYQTLGQPLEKKIFFKYNQYTKRDNGT